MKALIVDGEEMLRLSMREVVSVAATFDEIIEAGSEADFVTKTASHNKLDLVIIHPSSLGRQGSSSGLEDGRNCLNLVKRLYPAAPILIVSDTSSSNDIWPEANIVSRSSSVTTMITKIRASLSLPAESPVRSFSAPATPNVRAFMKNNLRPTAENDASYVDLSRLSFRQKQILAMAADGLPNKEIAARLGIAEGTVKAHMHAIFKVLDVSNRTQAVIKYGAINRVSPAPTRPMHQQAI